ncbi:prepilin-type N-terminal cleavage/methylation domain-containing protein [Planococcus sp. APC 3906]|uniref:prepilin-type N-terminal cleavage/methylation domain-containing protein n=1 Tax=Planococcus sp. APC 3906 TaxID=3035194 RepID=UPI0025B60FF3|nr:prepilin-type N-terminal cleavage/methylation domain-containing protein [Planococcus sp. APC 3906]MDN3449169.1 prepilin-type N-terminal cleavage/methylation domain-containing protein [Planococcus sp. APC 3906]
MKLNQKGMSLVELLAALALVSLIAGIAWTALSIGFKHTAVETGKTLMQQDANIIIATLTNEHRRNSNYSLVFEGNKLKIETCSASGSCSSQVLDQKYDFSGTVINGIVIDSHDSTPVDQVLGIEPKKKNTDVILKLTDLNNSNNSVTIKTALTRILTN